MTMTVLIIFLVMSLCLTPPWPGSPGGHSWGAEEGPKTSSLGGLPTSPLVEPSTLPPEMRLFVLEPFYFFREKQGRAQVERVIVTLEIPGDPQADKVDWHGEMVRSAFYLILSQTLDEASQQQQCRELLRLKFGQQESASLKIVRSLLLLP